MKKTVCVLLAVAGCSSSSSPVPASQFPSDYAKAYCQKAFACCTSSEIQMKFAVLGITDEPSCDQKYGALLQQFVLGGDPSKYKYSASCGGELVANIDGWSCAEFVAGNSMPAPCELTSGTVANGGTCTVGSECTSGLCSFTGQQSTGTCTAYVPEGSSCSVSTSSGICVQGTFCQGSTGTPTCVALLADGGTCMFDSQCQSGACNGANPSSGTTGTCGAPTTCNGV